MKVKSSNLSHSNRLSHRLGWLIIGCLAEIKARLPVSARCHQEAILFLQKQINEREAYSPTSAVHLVTVMQSQKVAKVLVFSDPRLAGQVYRLCRETYGAAPTQQFDAQLNQVPPEIDEFQRLYAMMEGAK